jgi:hypothetical protein
LGFFLIAIFDIINDKGSDADGQPALANLNNLVTCLTMNGIWMRWWGLSLEFIMKD